MLNLNVSFSDTAADVVLKQSDARQAKPGESVQLKCAVEGFSVSSYWMAWIRQAPGKPLEWLLSYYSSGSEYYNSAIKGRFIPSKDSANFYMQMNDLRADDTAVYYCARDTINSVMFTSFAASSTTTISLMNVFLLLFLCVWRYKSYKS
uniref:Ig-like domain-containing protein n=1 Tax=Erpetoichthys calabaricus TaxID=27687 RepID=A0A8C4RFQ9_ERPCA